MTENAYMKKNKDTQYRLEVRESPIQGRGLFALEDIPWGKKIKQYGGKIINDKEAATRKGRCYRYHETWRWEEYRRD